MSFDIWLVCLNKGDVAKFPRAMLEEAFAPFVETKEPKRLTLADSLAEVWLDDAPDIEGFTVTRPPADTHHPFWSALLDIMRRTQTVLHWPTGGPKPHAVVADKSVIAHMPPDMIKVVGTPRVVRKPDEFWKRIAESGA